MTILVLLCGGWILAATLMWLMFLHQKRTGDAGIVDIAWAAGVGGLGILYALISSGNFERRMILISVVGVWSLRLAYHIYRRVKSMPEDGRYQSLKAEWGTEASSRMFRFYQMQGIAVVLFASPILIAAQNPQPIGWLDLLGALVGLIGIIGESVADYQLSKFRAEPKHKGKVCQAGLWNYSRHPNYFFEWMHWWAYVLLAISFPWGWLTLIGPLTMWYFITQVTGIPPTEAQAIKSRGDAYRQYQQTTNAFFPGPRRSYSHTKSTDRVAT